jgi:hypothetical protein
VDLPYFATGIIKVNAKIKVNITLVSKYLITAALNPFFFFKELNLHQ